MARKIQSLLKSPASRVDAITLLTAAHRDAFLLFDEFRQSDDDSERSQVCERACELLTVHAQIVEELFYPAVQAALDESDLVDQARLEHDVVRGLVEQVQEEGVRSGRRDELFELLIETVGNYIDETEGDLFPEVRRSDLDLKALAKDMLIRKKELEAEFGLADEDEDVSDNTMAHFAR